MTKKIVLVTGGAGYIGSQLVGLLLNSNYYVIVVDSLIFGGESLLNFWHHPDFVFIKEDITQTEQLNKIFVDYPIEVVIHLAAIVGDPACAKQPELAKKTNYEASVNLLELSQKHKIGRFVFASTCSNYGKMQDFNSYVDEESPLAPVSLYAELKVKFEQELLARKKSDELFCSTILRFATVYGASPRMRFDLTVNEFTKELTLGRPLEVFGEQFWRPYCHVYDFARAILLVIESNQQKVAYNIFNVGDTQENYQKQMIIEEIKKVIPTAQ
ncbi:MAG: NAD-dependent epimerase/dehydratase family protein, partial [bacterium]|nr:NAD-dependent epimerase/dehydratase family protein [bacterium]